MPWQGYGTIIIRNATSGGTVRFLKNGLFFAAIMKVRPAFAQPVFCFALFEKTNRLSHNRAKG